MKFRN